MASDQNHGRECYEQDLHRLFRESVNSGNSLVNANICSASATARKQDMAHQDICTSETARTAVSLSAGARQVHGVRCKEVVWS